VIPTILSLCLLGFFVASNYRQLYSWWVVRQETKRLVNQALIASFNSHQTIRLEDDFHESLSEDVWKLVLINGAGKVSNGTSWHATALNVANGLTISHFPDLAFANESSNIWQSPAAEQYNNITIITKGGFFPTPTKDIVLSFSMRASANFWGTAGVIFQLQDTIGKDGIFRKPFNMFGVSVVGRESTVFGHNGSLCYLALNWLPICVESVEVDAHAWHNYEIYLRWISTTEWVGIVFVDGEQACPAVFMPALGPLEVHIWADNYLPISQPRRWWQIGPSMHLQFQDGGEKQFMVKSLRLSDESRL